MNFDFLKGLRGLDTVYGSCSDAEELVRSKPYLSLTAARKSAELLAKFIYMAAHASVLQELTFADILSDYQVKRFINDRGVMDAFHYIRKSGNMAVHGEQEVSTETALAVLQNLHYVAGETAKALALISSYPDFDENIEDNPYASFDENIQISDKAMHMFLDYVGEQERDEYGRFVTIDLTNPAHLQYILHGIVDMHEYIEFYHQPYYKTTLEYLQQYLIFLDDMAWERKDPDPDSSSLVSTVKAKIIIKIDDEIVYSNDRDENLNDVLFNHLPQAKHFSIDCKVFGNLRSFHDNPDPNAKFDTINEEELWQGRGMSDQLEGLRRKEAFIYKAVFQYPDDDNKTVFAYIRNGKSYDVEDICRQGIVSKATGMNFYGNMMIMQAEFDCQLEDDIKKQLRNAVRNYVTENELPYIEDVWEEEDEEADGDTICLLSGTEIIDGDLSESKAFADKINQILSTISERCTMFFGHQYARHATLMLDPATIKSPSHAKHVKAMQELYAGIDADPSIPELDHCFYDAEHFGVAAFVWKDNKLQLVGTIL